MRVKEDNDGGRGQGCWIMASVVKETMQEEDYNYWVYVEEIWVNFR